jgi:hypothetical protein
MKPRKTPTPSRPKLRLIGGAVLGLSLILASADETLENELREWKSEDGKHSVEASLIAFNEATMRVTLKKGDSSSLEVPLAKLSTADQAYIREWAPRLSGRKEVGEAIRLYGVTWQPEIEDALKLASSDATSVVSRPVMWFRVLGKLDEGM